MNKITVVLSPSNLYAKYAYITLKSIINSSCEHDYFDVKILFDELSDENVIFLKSMECERMYIDFHNVNDYINIENMRNQGYVSKNTYFRIVAPRIFKDKKKIIYVDCDMIINNNLRSLYEEYLGNSIIGAVRNWSNENEKKYVTYELHLSNETYFNAGILIIDVKKYIESKIEDKSLNLLKDKQYKYFDQDILNIVLKEKVKIIDGRWNLVWHPISNRGVINSLDKNTRAEWENAFMNPYVIHYTSAIKPWNSYGLPLSDFFWNTAKETSIYAELLEDLFINMQTVIINSDNLDIVEQQYKRGMYSFSEISRNYLNCLKIWIKKKVGVRLK